MGNRTSASRATRDESAREGARHRLEQSAQRFERFTHPASSTPVASEGGDRGHVHVHVPEKSTSITRTQAPASAQSQAPSQVPSQAPSQALVPTFGGVDSHSSNAPELLARVGECLTRDGKPLIRDELVALILTLRPDFPMSELRALRIEDLNRQIRSLIVEIKLDAVQHQQQHQHQQQQHAPTDPPLNCECADPSDLALVHVANEKE